MTNPGTAFDAAMLRRMPHAHVRPEAPEDMDFLIALFRACSPMTGVLPDFIVNQQAELANHSFHSAHPDGMRRIVMIDRQPMARIMVDWQHATNTHGIDIAVMPQARKTGVGLYMLQAWVEVADQLGRSCTLEVIASNPARKIYQRLGFEVNPDMDESHAVFNMTRKARPAQKG